MLARSSLLDTHISFGETVHHIICTVQSIFRCHQYFIIEIFGIRFTYNGRRYDRLSLSEKIRAGAEVSELVKRLTGRNYPAFFDNMESVDDLSNIRPTSQMILAKCVRNAELSVRAGSTAMPKAA